MYKNILVPMALDHGVSQGTLSIARNLCASGGTITALHVYEMPSGSVSAFLDEDLVRSGFEAAQTRLDAKLAEYDDVQGVLKKGHAARMIVDYAAEAGADCIVIGSHKPGFRDFLLGSTAARVVRHATCAVHVNR